MTQINEELVDFLSQPKQLPTAYAVADWIDTDGSKAKHPLDSCSADRESKAGSWISSCPEDSERGCINLSPAAEAVDTANMLQVSSENLTGPTNAHEAGFFGIWKGPANEDDPELSAELKREGFKTRRNWIGWKWYKTEGLPDFLRSREDVIQLNADNHTEDKPLASSVAQILWRLFEAHRLRLEELNRRVNGIRF
jgi:hypothetical protein